MNNTIAAAFCAVSLAATAALAADPPQVSPSKLVNEQCGVCHGLSRVRRASFSPEGWLAVVQRMVKNGAKLSPEEAKAVAAYLAKAKSK